MNCKDEIKQFLNHSGPSSSFGIERGLQALCLSLAMLADSLNNAATANKNAVETLSEAIVDSTPDNIPPK